MVFLRCIFSLAFEWESVSIFAHFVIKTPLYGSIKFDLILNCDMKYNSIFSNEQILLLLVTSSDNKVKLVSNNIRVDVGRSIKLY